MGLNVEALRSSFELVAPRADELTEKFYATLFMRYPQVVPLFQDADMDVQRRKLATALAFVVRNLENEDALVDTLEGLGARHIGYGAKTEHYPAVGECLLESLKSIAGEHWNAELETAWTEAYEAVAQIMMRGAAKAEETQPA